MSKVYAFDIDDTILDLLSPSLSVLCRLYGDRTLEDMHSVCSHADYDPNKDYFAQLFGVTLSAVLEMYTEYAQEVYSSPDFYPEALSYIEELLKDPSNKVIFITARDEMYREVTQASLDAVGLGGLPLYCESNKVPLALSLGVDVFFEDNLANAKQLHDAGIEVHLVNAPRNWGVELPYPRYEWSIKYPSPLK